MVLMQTEIERELVASIPPGYNLNIMKIDEIMELPTGSNFSKNKTGQKSEKAVEKLKLTIKKI